MRLAAFGHWLCGGRGILSLGQVITGEVEDLVERRRAQERVLRKFIREQSSYESSHTGSLTEKRRRGLGAYQSMRQIYDAYKWSKSQQLEVALVATGLNNELSPTLLEIDGRLVSLDGSLQQRYQKWRRILHELFLLETGVDGTSG